MIHDRHLAQLPVSAADYAAGRSAAFVPQTEEDWALALRDPWWRITSGQLYKIIVKGDDEDSDGNVEPFRPNVNQMDFLRTAHDRSVICKARQLGFCLDPATRVLTADLPSSSCSMSATCARRRCGWL